MDSQCTPLLCGLCTLLRGPLSWVSEQVLRVPVSWGYGLTIHALLRGPFSWG